MKKVILIMMICLLANKSFSQDIIKSINKTSFVLAKKLNLEKDNLIFSPTSISSAIALTYIGAKENTFKEIAKALNFDTDLKSFNQSYSIFSEKNFYKQKQLSIVNANSIWYQTNMPIELIYKNQITKYYNSEIHTTNFSANPNKSANVINKWVSENTNHKIKELLKSQDIDNSTRLVLVNALYFRCAWEKQFNEKSNVIDDFYTGEYSKEQVTYMNASINSWYYENSYSKIIEIPYANHQISMIIIIPKSLKKKIRKELLNNLDYNLYNEFLEKKERYIANIYIPKFKTETELNLKPLLKKIGINDAFTSSANFSGISSNNNLYIDKVLHKATIDVNEKGTEATAATAVVMRKTAIRAKLIDIKIDKPFIFIIKNNKTNLIYFIGAINNPNIK
ncbi:MAG: serpin family protein [Bacteroidales bacterium]|nr:serpin family protein [Bacteroidales bacterium]